MITASAARPATGGPRPGARERVTASGGRAHSPGSVSCDGRTPRDDRSEELAGAARPDVAVRVAAGRHRASLRRHHHRPGAFTTWPTWNKNYDLLAEGFRSGHLYLSVPPPPALLAKADPFNPALAVALVLGRQPPRRPLLPLLGPAPGRRHRDVKTVFRIRRHRRRPVPGVRALYDLPGRGRAADHAHGAPPVRSHAGVADGAVHRRVRVREPHALPDRGPGDLRGRDRGRPGVLLLGLLARVRGALARGSPACAGGC